MNPFISTCGEKVTVADRLSAINGFDREQLLAALQCPGLQKSVERRIKSRLKTLDKEQAS